MTKYNIYRYNRELYFERKHEGHEWETLPIEQAGKNLFEISFYGYYGTATTTDEAFEKYEQFEAAYLMKKAKDEYEAAKFAAMEHEWRMTWTDGRNALIS